uniref:Uncharacterized protein n=1 Tax=Caenorhabditis tropicalis TaxID=1561998 RepID=A0A1I7V441_9PELO
MRSLALFLVLTTFLYSSVECGIIVLADPSSCVHMMCEWRGVGKHCKNTGSHGKKKTLKDGFEVYIPFGGHDELESRKLARIKAKYPLNTFTIPNEGNELCQGRKLWCNTDHWYPVDDYDEFLKILEDPTPLEIAPRIDCQPSFSISS